MPEMDNCLDTSEIEVAGAARPAGGRATGVAAGPHRAREPGRADCPAWAGALA
ncbi:hypothetical protein [Nocardia sp. NBC_00511]|uniref:hypothetical protein n=1 Tax=Nocardia sp. NBC_00511 TaxID=2903591 RepID=UPI0030E35188